MFTSNIFAVMGLRALYFLLAGVMTLFRYLNYGLSARAGVHWRENDRQAGIWLGAGARGIAAGDYWSVGDVDRGIFDCCATRKFDADV